MDAPRGIKRKRASPDAEEADEVVEAMGALDVTWSWGRMVRHMRKKISIPLKISWEELPCDLAVMVLGMILIHRDRIRMSAVNRHWNLAFKDNSSYLQPGMPSLLLPSSTRTLVHEFGYTTYEIHLPQDIRQRGRICGSSEGGWIVLALEDPPKHILFNIHNNERFKLPSTTISVDGQIQIVNLVAAVLSRPPSDAADYVVGAILSINGHYHMASCGHESAHWLNVLRPRNKRYALRILDLIYYRDGFYYLTSDQNLHVLHPDQANLHSIIPIECWMNLRDFQFEGITTRQYYLLQAGQQLFKVIKYGGADWRTSHFNIFVLNQREEESCWSRETRGIGGLTMFVGRASSRLLQVPGSHLLSDSIQFYDDRTLPVPHLPDFFQRSDMGSFSLVDSAVHWPPAGGEMISPSSDRIPPAWWLH